MNSHSTSSSNLLVEEMLIEANLPEDKRSSHPSTKGTKNTTRKSAFIRRTATGLLPTDTTTRKTNKTKKLIRPVTGSATAGSSAQLSALHPQAGRSFRKSGIGGHQPSTLANVKYGVKCFNEFLNVKGHAFTVETSLEHADVICDVELFQEFGTYMAEHLTKDQVTRFNQNILLLHALTVCSFLSFLLER